MEWTGIVRERLRQAGSTAPPDAVVDEIAEHLEQRYDEAVAAGADPAAAGRDALADLEDLQALAQVLRNNPQPDVQRAPLPPFTEGPHMWSDLSGDIRYATRLLRRNSGFAVAALLTIALGVGAATAIFSVVDAVLLRPLPYPDAERLVAVWETDCNSGTVREPASLPDLLDLREQSQRIDGMGGVIPTELNLTGTGEPRRLAGLYVSSQLLPLLGVRPLTGRLFTGAEHQAGRDDVVVISERLRARTFTGNSSAIGRMLRLDDRPRTVIGVVPDTADVGVLQWLLAADYGRGFADRDVRTRVDVWLPIPVDPHALPRDTHPVLTLGRIGRGHSLIAAQQELDAVMARLELAFPSNRARGAHAEPFTDVVLGRVRSGLWALLAGVGLVLVIGCVNVANLLLVRGTRRLREVAVRTALGATARRLRRQFLVENALLALVGGGLGIAVSFALVRVLVALSPADVPRLEAAVIDGRVLAIALAVTAVVALAFGLVPVLQARRLDVSGALAADGGRAETGAGASRRVRSGLVVAEIALAVVLTVGAGLMVRTVLRLRTVNPGFDVAHVLKAEFQLPPSRYPVDFRRWPNFVEMHRFNAALLEQVRRLPGVESVALAGSHPLDAGFTNSFQVVGRESESRSWPEIAVRRMTPGYFAALRVPAVRGRLLLESDDTNAPPVVLVNEAAANRFFDRRDPIGQEIRLWGTARRIVGIVGNERFHGVATAPAPAVYAPLAQTPSANGAEVLLVRAAQPAGMETLLRTAIRRVDPALAVFGEEPLAATLTESLGQRRFVMGLLTAFAVAALFLAALGIYGVLSYDVAQRRREIGIRMALGALPSAVGRLVVRRGLILAGFGLLVGGLASVGLTRVLRGLLFEVVPGDVATLLAVSLLLGTVAGLASYLPARRVLQTDPITALRDE